jgi:hypothetical protein
MALPKSLTQPFRRNQIIVGGGWRAFFAPYNAALAVTNNSTALGPYIIDLQVQGPFNQNAPPTGYTDLGWIMNYKFTPASKIGIVRSGYRGAARALYRGEVGETFTVTFREMSRMSYKIASGSEIFNLLSNPNAAASMVGPLSSSGALAVALGASGYVVAGAVAGYVGQPTLFVPAGSGAAFPAGNYIVADDDYVGQYGIVGAAGIPVFQNAVNDVDFIRKTSDFVARVVAVVAGAVAGQDALILNGPFVGGGNAAVGTPLYGPDANAKVQNIKGYTTREGGTYVTEWSALLCLATIDGSQIALYYPHVAPSSFKGITPWQLENAGTTDLTGQGLDAELMAMAFDDPLDGETVVRYAAYYPTTLESPQI